MIIDGYEFGLFYVYAIKTKVAVGLWSPDTAVYVGMTNNPAGRWGKHITSVGRREASKCPRVIEAFEAHGVTSFYLQVLHCVDTKAEALRLELAEIASLNTKVTDGGCNETGPDKAGVRRHSTATKKRIAETNRVTYSDPAVRAKIGARISLSRKARSPEGNQKHWDAIRAAKANPITRARHSISARESWRDPVKRANRVRGNLLHRLRVAEASGDTAKAAHWRAIVDGVGHVV